MVIYLFPGSPLPALLVLWATLALAICGGIAIIFWSVMVLKVIHPPVEDVLSPCCQYRALATSRGIDVRSLVSNKRLSRIRFRFSQPLRSLFWSPDSACLTTVSEVGVLQVWHAWTGRMLFCSSGLVEKGISVAWSPDMKYLALFGFEQCIQIWDVLSWECISLPTSHEPENYIHCMIWSSTGRFLAIAGTTGIVYVWDGAKRDLHVWQDNQGNDIIALAFSEDGLYLLLGSMTGRVSALDVMERREVWSYQHQIPIEAVYWGRGNQLGDVFAKDSTGYWLHLDRQQVLASL